MWPCDVQLRVELALGLARGMEALYDHSPPIQHRDIKSMNVLVSQVNVEDDFTIVLVNEPICAALCFLGLGGKSLRFRALSTSHRVTQVLHYCEKGSSFKNQVVNLCMSIITDNTAVQGGFILLVRAGNI
jgi:hypothetical protein